MAGQMHELLLTVSSKLDGVERVLADLRQAQRDHEKEMANIRERLASLENDRRWTGEERRRVDDRLGSGDHTFLRLQQQMKNAEKLAAQAIKLADQAMKAAQNKPEGTAIRKKFLSKLAEHAAPVVVSVILWLLYHLLLVGPKIAEAIKPHGGHP